MTNDTVNQKSSNEKSEHEIMHGIDIRIIALKNQLNELSKCLLKKGGNKDAVLTITALTGELNKLQLQLRYYDEIAQAQELQQQNEPLIIKSEDK
jgi:hypothetical protein